MVNIRKNAAFSYTDITGCSKKPTNKLDKIWSIANVLSHTNERASS